MPTHTAQTRMVPTNTAPIRNRLLAPEPVVDLDDARQRHGAGHAIRAARHRTPESIIGLIEAAGLRGRGGAGFPTGRKWRSVRDAATTPPTVVVNAAEGEPGTFKDRLLLRSDPYRVLEGACIASRAMGGGDIVVALKASFGREIERVHQAIEEIAAAGWFEHGTIRVVTGPGEYLFGEDTALLEVAECRPPFPRVVPSYREGLSMVTPDGRVVRPPTLVNNVETLANVPGILRHGADWFREAGTPSSPGTLLCTVSGATGRHGVAEFEMGTPLRAAIETIGVEVPEIGVVLVGVSSPPVTPDQLGIPLTYEAFAGAGSGLGSASFIVIDASTPLRDVAAGVARFLAVESCGQCAPCKHDGLDLVDGLVAGDDPLVASRLGTVARGARCALARQTERVVGRLVELAGPGGGRPAEPYPIAPVVDIVDGRAVIDEAHLRKRADWSYEGEEPDSHLDPRRRYADTPVVIRPPHRTESDRGTTSAAAPVGGARLFGAVHDADDRIEETLAAIRCAEPGRRTELAERLRHEIELHHDAVERFVYPLLERVDPDEGTEVAWYPRRHEEVAERFLEGEPDDLDAACDELHVSVLELERRVLPLLEHELEPDHRRPADDAVRAVLEASR